MCPHVRKYVTHEPSILYKAAPSVQVTKETVDWARSSLEQINHTPLDSSSHVLWNLTTLKKVARDEQMQRTAFKENLLKISDRKSSVATDSTHEGSIIT